MKIRNISVPFSKGIAIAALVGLTAQLAPIGAFAAPGEDYNYEVSAEQERSIREAMDKALGYRLEQMARNEWGRYSQINNSDSEYRTRFIWQAAAIYNSKALEFNLPAALTAGDIDDGVKNRCCETLRLSASWESRAAFEDVCRITRQCALDGIINGIHRHQSPCSISGRSSEDTACRVRHYVRFASPKGWFLNERGLKDSEIGMDQVFPKIAKKAEEQPVAQSLYNIYRRRLWPMPKLGTLQREIAKRCVGRDKRGNVVPAYSPNCLVDSIEASSR